MEQESFGQMFKRLRGRMRLGLREFCLENGFDAGNISRIERGRMAPPQSRELLERHAEALGLEKGSAEWTRFFDLARLEQGRIPDDLCEEEVLAKMPLLFRCLRDRDLSREDVERLIEMVRES